jgi:hypothetical protein
MGTNYYLYERGDLLERLQRDDPLEPIELHIGKSSGGWCFALRVYPELGINSLTDWYHRMRRNNNVIKDEYGSEWTIDELLREITDRKWRKRTFHPTDRCPTEEAMLQFNSAVYGPNNLLRAKIGGHCIGHGPGTWDLIEGDFS